MKYDLRMKNNIKKWEKTSEYAEALFQIIETNLGFGNDNATWRARPRDLALL